MNYWVITDTHFGHNNMIEYCGRPEGFEKLLMSRIWKTLKHNDVLIHLGDICIGNDEDWHLSLMSYMPICKKWLIKGNHDKKSNSWYLSHGWNFVGDTFQTRMFGKDIIFSHKPKADKDFDINIHGHFHNQLPRLKRQEWAIAGEKERNYYDLSVLSKKHILVMMEHHYAPISLKSLL